MRKLFIGALLLVAATNVLGKNRQLELDELRGHGYIGVHSHVNHNERLDYQLGTVNFLIGVPGQVLKATDAVKQGHALREEYGIDDPAVEIAKNIAGALGTALQLPVSSSRNAEFKSVLRANSGLQNAEDLAAIAKPGSLVINVGSNAWRVYKYGKDRYFVLYGVLAEIVDAAQGKVLWKGECLFPKPLPKKNESPVAATALDNDAQSLKSEFSRAASVCTERLLSDMI